MWTLLSLTAMLWAEEPEQDTSTETTEDTEKPSEDTQSKDTSTKDSKSTGKDKKEKTKKAKTPKKEKPPKDSNAATSTTPITGFTPHIVVGLETGAALSTTDLRASFLPQLHFGVQLPYWNERVGILFQGVYRASKMDAKANAGTLTSESYSYSLTQQEGEVGMNLRVRIPEVPVVTPEIWLGPTVQMLQTTVEGKGGAAFPTTVEQLSRIGLHAALLGEYALPVGQLIGGVHYTTYEFRGTIQGDTRNHAISPTLGYRYRFF